MAEHRRVEPRSGLAGTGMATDVERLRDIESDYQRRERAWREGPERGFGEVLEDAPAHGELEDEEHPDPRRRPQRPDGAPREVEMAKAAASERAATGAPDKPAPRLPPRLPPDPRAAALHRQLQQRAQQKAQASVRQQVLPEPRLPAGVPPASPEPVRIEQGAGDTPPTGNPVQRTRRP
jgi:hypothetical protein